MPEKFCGINHEVELGSLSEENFSASSDADGWDDLRVCSNLTMTIPQLHLETPGCFPNSDNSYGGVYV